MKGQIMATITRKSARETQEYCDRVFDDKDYKTSPTDGALRTLSTLLDGSICRSYDQVVSIWNINKSHAKGLKTLCKAPSSCGEFAKNPLLPGYTPFEQMQVVKEYVEKKGPNFKKAQTFSLAQGNEYVPVQIKVPRNSKNGATSWTTIIGTNRGKLKAPSYAEFVGNDPTGTLKGCLISPLDHLEIVRQPERAASVVMKADLFTHRMPHDRRYRFENDDGSFYGGASVELPKQHSKTTREHKLSSAGFNLADFISDSNYRSKNMLPKTLLYEDYYDDGYDDDAIPVATPKRILRSIPKALKGDTDPLDEEMSRLFANQLGISNTKSMKIHTRRKLFNDEK